MFVLLRAWRKERVWGNFLLQRYFSDILENALWKALKRKLKQIRKKRQVQKAVSFFEGLDEGQNEEGLEFVQLQEPDCIPLSVFLLTLTSKDTMMLQAVLWSLDIPC